MTTITTFISKTYTTATTAAEASTTAVFVFREDGWFNMTKAAKAFGKRPDNFWSAEETQPYCNALKESLKISELIETKRGGQGGTWAHPKLAVFFARWLDIKFSVWCDAVIDDILRGHQTLQMVNKAESAVAALPADVLAAGAAWQAEMHHKIQQDYYLASI